jgi:hypothetical protein
MVLQRVGVASVARVAGALYAGLGLIVGVIFACLALLGFGFASAAGGEDAPPAFVGIVFGAGAVIFLPALYGLLGACVAAIMASLYNFVASRFGGVEVELG